MLVMKTEFNKNLIFICFSIASEERSIMMKIVAELTAISATLLELSAEYQASLDIVVQRHKWLFFN